MKFVQSLLAVASLAMLTVSLQPSALLYQHANKDFFSSIRTPESLQNSQEREFLKFGKRWSVTTEKV
jgi:hypothetical protein